MKKRWKNFYKVFTIALKFGVKFNANFVLLYISQVELYKNVIPLSQKCGEKQKGSVFKVGPHLSFLKPF